MTSQHALHSFWYAQGPCISYHCLSPCNTCEERDKQAMSKTQIQPVFRSPAGKTPPKA